LELEDGVLFGGIVALALVPEYKSKETEELDTRCGRIRSSEGEVVDYGLTRLRSDPTLSATLAMASLT